VREELVKDPWERQPNESVRAYEAFKIYLDLGAQRSQVKVAEKLDKSSAIVARWSIRHAWRKRMEAWETEQDREWLKERRRSLREANRRHTTLAKSMTGKIASRLKVLKVEELSPQDLARWLDVAVKIERLGLGLSTSNHEHTGHDGGPMEVISAAKERLAGLLGPLVAEAQAGSLDSDADE
jgi:hypothetical protein